MTEYEKRDAVAEFADKFIRAIENGQKDGKWVRPWRSVTSNNWPMNVVSKKNYRGINLWILLMGGHSSNVWGTMKQWADKGYVTPAAYWARNGKVGERPASERQTGIVFWKKIDKEDKEKKDSDGNPVRNRFMLMRTYFVLNSEQVVNAETGEPYQAPVKPVSEGPEKTQTQAHDALKAYCDRESIPLTHSGDRAYYVSSLDSITLPIFEAFHSEQDYLATFAHECVHSTGHEKRLNRELKGKYDRNSYAFEELVAEIGATMACANLGIIQSDEIPDNHVKYVKGWLEILKGDSKAILSATQLAQKAVDCMLPADDEESE